MAFLQINLYSKALSKLVSFNALIPIDIVDEQNEALKPKGQMKALYLLHGYSGNYHNWRFWNNCIEKGIECIQN